MRFPLSKTVRRRSNKKLQYEGLEERCVLASIVAFDAGTGALTITMQADNDTANVNISNGNIEVNGSEDVDTAAANTQTATFTSLRSITVVGNSGFANQTVSFGGNYSTGNGGQIQTISVLSASNVSFTNLYDLAAGLNVTMSGSGGSISDSAGAVVTVGGATTIAANDNTIALNNSGNNFVGVVNASTTGTNRDISFADANAIQLGTVVSSGNLNVTAVGNVTDAAGATITAGDGLFVASGVVLGDNTSDNVNFTRFASSTPGGLTELNQDSLVILLNIEAEDLTVRTPLGIYDGRSTTITVTDTATFESGTRIRIGENGTDTFNAGRLNFVSSGHAHIWENSGTLVTGTNSASSLNLFSEGDITDDATASINVTNVTGFDAANIVLGDTATDQFNSGALYFFTPGDFFVNEDSGMHIIETKNSADRMVLRSPGSITDADNAQITVTRLSQFTANSVNLGDAAGDVFNSGSIQFNTNALFKLTENSNMNIVGNNTANNSIIESAGAITDTFTAQNGDGTMINVATVAEFTGTSIDLGTESNVVMNFGALRFTSAGTVLVSEDSATNLTLASTAAQLTLVSTAAVTDATDASLNVTGVANIAGSSIVLGDSATDTFNANSVTLNSPGAVAITENSAMNLHKTSTASSMVLAANGTLTDGIDANTTVTGLFSVTGTLINLGSESTDNLNVGSMTFNSMSNSNITADSNIVLAGLSNVGDQLFLTSVGNITDNADAETKIQNRVFLQGVDVIVGELANDCFDILNGDTSDLFVTASGTQNVLLGC